MLFEMTDDKLAAVPFLTMADLTKIEKDLENLLSKNMFDKLYEDNPYMVIFQERAFKAEPDIIALDREGNLVIFELKRVSASADALSQLFRYAQVTQKMNYETLEHKYRQYTGAASPGSLKEVHKETFNLDSALSENQFNRDQQMIVVGSSADEELAKAIRYWSNRGIGIDFVPYRIYRMGKSSFFEFFSKPFDTHANPGFIKGVIFDTSRTWDEAGLSHMLAKSRVSAFGERKDAIFSLAEHDYVFLSHRYVGIVAGGRVKSVPKKATYEKANDELYVDVEWLTPIPTSVSGEIPHVSFGAVQEITNKSFYWARIDKRPFLTKEESEVLVQKMKERLARTEETTRPSARAGIS